ncbi:MAG TPA: alpha-amylase/4-alpha-glucanotransferase domain-containing protein, partial [Pirellulales bacterium]
QPIKITKGITLESGNSNLEIAYLLEGLPLGQQFHFSVEFNFAGLPAACDDRYFYDGDRRRLGHLGAHLDLRDATAIGLVDEYLGIDVGLKSSRACGVWTYPVETVSQSEGGFELVHQSVVVQPHWLVEADSAGRWIVTMELSIDTSLAERRRRQPALAAVR